MYTASNGVGLLLRPWRFTPRATPAPRRHPLQVSNQSGGPFLSIFIPFDRADTARSVARCRGREAESPGRGSGEADLSGRHQEDARLSQVL